MHYKQKITKRNEWIIDHCDILHDDTDAALDIPGRWMHRLPENLYLTPIIFKKGKKTVSVKKTVTKKTIKKLAAGKKYYVRVRSYRKAGGKKLYSKWSAVKTVKTAK